MRRIMVGTSQSTGVERAHNEDALFALLGSASGEGSVPDFGLFVVADGMGGHRSGEVASSVSVRSVAHRLAKDSLLHLLQEDGVAEDMPIQELVRQALEEANHSVVSRVPGGGTTLTAVLLLGSLMTIGRRRQPGYLFSNGHAGAHPGYSWSNGWRSWAAHEAGRLCIRSAMFAKRLARAPA
jgi:serine/threonine protein phosphatase PrpC